MSDRYAAVSDTIARTLRECGRPDGSCRLLAVTKTVPVDRIRQAMGLGIRLFGENRVQEAEGKRELLATGEWHLIGRLQRNKARRAVALFHVIQSVDRWELAETLARLGAEQGSSVRILVEVNPVGEASKAGLPPEEVPGFFRRLRQLPEIRAEGLMTVAPQVDRPEEARGVFRRVALLAEDLRQAGFAVHELSMGMSGDYPVAIQEGSTLVRVGSALFGARG